MHVCEEMDHCRCMRNIGLFVRNILVISGEVSDGGGLLVVCNIRINFYYSRFICKINC